MLFAGAEFDAMQEATREMKHAVQPLLFKLFCCALVSRLAVKRGYSSVLWFAASFLTHPFLTVCVVASLPDRMVNARRRFLEQALACGESSFSAAVGQPGRQPPAEPIGNVEETVQHVNPSRSRRRIQ